jgi:hypothetical protein
VVASTLSLCQVRRTRGTLPSTHTTRTSQIYNRSSSRNNISLVHHCNHHHAMHAPSALPRPSLPPSLPPSHRCCFTLPCCRCTLRCVDRGWSGVFVGQGRAGSSRPRQRRDAGVTKGRRSARARHSTRRSRRLRRLRWRALRLHHKCVSRRFHTCLVALALRFALLPRRVIVSLAAALVCVRQAGARSTPGAGIGSCSVASRSVRCASSRCW